MKKNAGNDETVLTDGGTNPDVVFNGDELVLDYLNALLSSVPAVKLDSGEIHFVHRAIEAGWKLTGITSPSGDTSLNFETERVKMEAEVLEIENKNLKFKTELAKIDAQVLRSENDNLRADITSLKAQQNETKCALDTMMAENSELKSSIEQLRNQLNVAASNAKDAQDAAADVHPEPVPDADRAAETDGDSVLDSPPDSEQVVQLDSRELDSSNTVTAQAEEPALNPVSTPPEAVRETSPDPVIVVQKPSVNDNAGSGIAPDTAFISRAAVVNDIPRQKAADEVVIISRNRVVADSSFQRARPGSKVMKQHQVTKFQSQQEPLHVVKFTAPEPVPRAETAVEAERKPDPVQELLVAEPETAPEVDHVSNKDALHPDVADEIDMEPAPVPKVVIRRHMKRYEDFQNEADSTHVVKVEHNIIAT